jgi:UDP-N-acetylmuramate: L-alanyl-gamma-D-glutamyl-meso-diaminopimelate ligase
MKIHMTGVCGIAMGTLAQMFARKGYTVSGSDTGIYPPMSDILMKSNITLFDGYKEDNIGADLVVIGNAVSRGNPEVEFILNQKIPYMSMAGALREFFLKDKEVIAVAGTHGKTTTTALLAHIFNVAGEAPSFFIGGIAKNFNSSWGLGTGKYFIIEADEYDSAFFEKTPKFIFYKPDHLIMTSLEFDHADIYNNVDEIELWFKRLVNIIPSGGNIVRCSLYDRLNTVCNGSLSRNFTYGSAASDFNYDPPVYKDEFSIMPFHSPDGEISLMTEIFGEFNFQNIAAAVSMALCIGIDKKKIIEAVKTFKGVLRRQELIYTKKNITIYEDFAHHPAAVKGVVTAFRKRFPGSKLFAVFEPRSATSRRNIFQHEFPGSFHGADRVMIKAPFEKGDIKNEKKFNAKLAVEEIKKSGINADLFETTDEIITQILKEIDFDMEIVILIMSNGGFDGIYNNLKDEIDGVII